MAEPQTAQQIALAWLQGLVPAMTAIAGGMWIAFTYLRNLKETHQETLRQAQRDEISRSIEARKPFLSRQLDLYFETATVVGKLATTKDRTSPIWSDNRARFEQLYWSELSLVEDLNVSQAMAGIRVDLDALATAENPLLDDTPQSRAKRAKRIDKAEAKLQDSALNLASTLKKSLENSWVVDSGITLIKDKNL
jgi:hypothetical protein